MRKWASALLRRGLGLLRCGYTSTLGRINLSSTLIYLIMKTKINELEKSTMVNYVTYQGLIQQKNRLDITLRYLLTGINIGHLLEERKKDDYIAIPKKRIKLAKRFQAVINDVYGGNMHLVQSMDEWIKLVSLNTEDEHRTENSEYSDVLFFLFTFKEVLQSSNDKGNFIEELLYFIYNLFDPEYIINDIDQWIRFVTLCTEKENYTGSEEYLGLLNFFFIFKEILQHKKSP